jgi:hypothetical protein
MLFPELPPASPAVVQGCVAKASGFNDVHQIDIRELAERDEPTADDVADHLCRRANSNYCLRRNKPLPTDQ